MKYRGFTFNINFVYTDGKYDGALFKDDADEGSLRHRVTLADIKEEVDEYYFQKQEYSVGEKVFLWVSEAMEHARQFGGIVEPRIQFDSI